MAKGVNIPIAADASGVVSEGKKVEGSLDRVIDSLDDVGDAGLDSGRTVEKSLDKVSDATKDAAQDVDRLEKKFRDSFDAVKKESSNAGKDLGDNIKRGTRDAESGLDDFKSEAASTARETAASFDGSADSIAGGFQEVAANALAGFGPLGAAAGLGIAAVGGAFYASFQKNAEKAEQRVSDMYDDMLESGADFLSKDYVADQLSKIYQGADDAAIKVKELRDLAAKTNISEPLLARALVGDEQARQEVTSEIARQRLKINEALDDATAKGSNLAPALAPAMEALRDVEDEISGVTEGFSEAQTNADAARRAIAGITAPTDGVARSAEDARSKFDGLGRMIGSLPNPTVTVAVNADLSAAKREIKKLTDGSYTVTVQGRAVGMRMV